jgi:hypothetical protein
MTRLCTDLPCTPFSLDLVAALPVPLADQLLFKEWKSYANLHKLDIANEHIAAEPVQASLCTEVLNGSWPTLHSSSVVVRSATRS